MPERVVPLLFAVAAIGLALSVGTVLAFGATLPQALHWLIG